MHCAGHTVSSVPEDLWERATDFTQQDNLVFLQPQFESPIVDGLAEHHGIVTMCLIWIPTIYICVSNFFKSLLSENKGLALRSLVTILVPFPIIQTLIKVVAMKVIPEQYKSKILQIIKPTYISRTDDNQKIDEEKAKKEIEEIEEMKAEILMAGTFYNSCPSICLQILIIITFPHRRISWLQIGSVCVSTVTTLWTAANLYQLQLEEEIDTQTKLHSCLDWLPEEK